MAEALLRQIQNLDDLDHEDAAAPRQWNRSQHLKFARKCKQLNYIKKKLSKKHQEQRRLLSKFNKEHAVRKQDIHEEGVSKIKGRGRWKTWTISMMLKSSFGNPYTKRKLDKSIKKISQLSHKSPAMFSVNSLAYWVSASTSHIARVRAAIAELWSKTMSESLEAIQRAKPFVTVLSIEFDASSTRSRFRQGTINTEGNYQFLVQRGHLFVQATPDATELKHSDLPITPAVLDRETAECIWKAIQDKHPVPLFSWMKTSDICVMRFISDNASANRKLFDAAVVPQRGRALVLQKLCSMHDLNHASEPILRAIGHLTPMFYCSGFFLTSNNYMRLIKHLYHWIHTADVVKVVYSRPDDAIIQHNLALIELALGPERGDAQKRWDSARDLLKVDNGSWSSPDYITHHCTGRHCCPNGVTETRTKLWLAILAYVFGIKATTPAISRWTTCGACCRYFMCAISYHNILHKGFALMQGPAGVASIKKSSDALIGEESMPASEFLQASVLPSSSGELYSRALRIKAWKTFAWLSRNDTLHELLMTCATIQPLERIMWVFLSWQSDGAILDSDSSPLGIMASETSPARAAIDKLLELMLSGRLFESSDLPDLLTIARNLPNMPDDFTRKTFWCNVQAIGQTYHRLVKEYQVYPFKLAGIVGDTSDDQKFRIASEFLELDDCCLSEGFCRPFREIIGDNGSAADLLPSGRLFLMLKATFQCLPFNIAVENSFARMKNTQKTCRGRNDVTDTLCAKHVLAEIKHAHLVGLKSFDPTTVEPAMGHVEQVNAPIAHAHDDQNQDQSASTRRRVFNGYSLFWKTAMDARLPLPGETDNQCRLRVREECTRDWNDQSEEGVNLRKLWGDKARHLNRSFKCNQSIVPAVMPSTQDASSLLEQLIESDKSKIQQLVPLPVPVGNKAHIGPCGLGNEFWAMREDLVANADVNPGFVKQFSNDWKQRAGGMVATNDQLPNRTVHLSCQQLYGFCVKQIKHMNDFNHVLKQLKQFVSNHRRLHVSGGKNKGPNLDHQCPLLVLKSVFATDDVSTSSSSTRPPSTTTIRVWLMCRWKFSPYEADWWEWEARHLNGELWEAKPLVSGESPFRLPMIFSQTEVARDTSNLMYDGCNRWIWKVIPYTVTGLDTIHFTMPTSDDDWFKVANDEVACSSDEEDRAIAITNYFLKAAKPTARNETTSVKRVGPGQGRSAKRRKVDGATPAISTSADPEHEPEALDEVFNPELDDAWTATYQADHGACVLQREASSTYSAPAPSSSARPNASAPKPTGPRFVNIGAEFQVCDAAGNVEIIQKPDGRIYVPDRTAPIGRLTEFKIDTPGHSVSMQCSLHSKCRKVMQLKSLPSTFQADALRWLKAGMELTDRKSADEHIALFNSFVMTGKL